MIRLKKYRDWSLKKKLLIFSALFILGSIYLVAFISYYKYTRDFEAQAGGRVQQIIEQVSFNIDSYLDDLYRLSLSVYLNDGIMEAIEETYDSSSLAQLEKRRLIENYLEEMLIYPRGDINRVFVITDEIYSSGRLQVSVDDTKLVKQYGWYKQAMATRDTIFVPAHMQQMVNQGPKVFSIVRQLRSTRNSDRILGVIKVDANYSGIENISRKVDMGKDGGLFIVDNRNNVIYQSTPRLDAVRFVKEIRRSGKSSTKVTYDGTPYLLNTTLLPRSNWSILAVNSLPELNAGARETRNFGLWIALLSAAFAFILLLWFLNKFLKPLLTVVRLMREVERGDLTVRFPDKRGDEVGYLGSSFNSLVSRISKMLEENTQLVKQVYETELLQKEAQVLALHNQIKPHFIFNTLNMISMQMQIGNQPKAIDHIHKLSSILRSMSFWDKDITLQREIELLNAYLSIQSSRYDGRLEYDIRIDPSLMSYPVPALLFQPIVENAVIHGCETKREKTTLRIYSELSGSRLRFVIRDTGIGMDPAALERLRRRLDGGPDEGPPPGPPVSDGSVGSGGSGGSGGRRKGHGIGLVNVNKRIRMKYGADYGLSVDSKLHHGTTVTIDLPVPSQEESGHV
ncbi:sensor histidine kinase [uncultured Paenibacillus sp.]|uniref:cache domain-containing sensor histidine kinase n=1 Tax=uncultured Paenibacillus sp. TaxID=227322 RepID=UPI0028D03531|nr:sensor histidine kinase [uncultured Paenibacillus sp.]